MLALKGMSGEVLVAMIDLVLSERYCVCGRCRIFGSSGSGEGSGCGSGSAAYCVDSKRFFGLEAAPRPCRGVEEGGMEGSMLILILYERRCMRGKGQRGKMISAGTLKRSEVRGGYS